MSSASNFVWQNNPFTKKTRVTPRPRPAAGGETHFRRGDTKSMPQGPRDKAQFIGGLLKNRRVFLVKEWHKTHLNHPFSEKSIGFPGKWFEKY